MVGRNRLECIVIGYNETPFETYEGWLRNYGEDSEAYRDLKYSFVEVDGRKLRFVDLMNYALSLAGGRGGRPGDSEVFVSGAVPNLAAVYLANYMRRRGINAKVLNLFQYQKEELRDYLKEDPYCVAITTTFYVINPPVTEMVDYIRAHNRNVKIIVGGPLIANHIRNYSGDHLNSILNDIGADIYVTDAQGEETLSALVQCLRNNGSLATVSNIIFKENGVLRATPPKTENNSMDENAIDWLSFPDEEFGPTIQTRTARSCAFSCSFCNYPTRAGKLTLASLETIEKELDSMYRLGNVRNVVFIDDTFNVPLQRFKDICRLMINKQYGFNWFSYFRCSNSDEEAIDLMARSGCKGVFLGIESGSPSILKNMNKAATVEKYLDGARLLRKHGILTFGSFIVGFPGETEQTVNETISFIKDIDVDYYRAQLWYCEPGTPIEQQREKYKIQGEGFVWTHTSMSSLEAMDHIDRMFLSINESLWLPQWSYDFWIIPYLLGKGVTPDQFRGFMSIADRILSMEIASMPEDRKLSKQRELLVDLRKLGESWLAIM